MLITLSTAAVVLYLPPGWGWGGWSNFLSLNWFRCEDRWCLQTLRGHKKVYFSPNGPLYGRGQDRYPSLFGLLQLCHSWWLWFVLWLRGDGGGNILKHRPGFACWSYLLVPCKGTPDFLMWDEREWKRVGSWKLPVVKHKKQGQTLNYTNWSFNETFEF